jgi:hypothetical protein
MTLKALGKKLAAELPNRRPDSEEDPDRLGHRDIDRVDWSSHVDSYAELDSDWWDHQKTAHPAQLTVAYASTAVINTLHDAVVSHYRETLDAELDSGVPVPHQLLLQLGKAGTGKSHVIWILPSQLQEIAAARGRQNPILRRAPTGAAAHNISGCTLHSFFKLTVKSGFTELSIPALTAAQN